MAGIVSRQWGRQWSQPMYGLKVIAQRSKDFVSLVDWSEAISEPCAMLERGKLAAAWMMCRICLIFASPLWLLELCASPLWLHDWKSFVASCIFCLQAFMASVSGQIRSNRHVFIKNSLRQYWLNFRASKKHWTPGNMEAEDRNSFTNTHTPCFTSNNFRQHATTKYWFWRYSILNRIYSDILLDSDSESKSIIDTFRFRIWI